MPEGIFKTGRLLLETQPATAPLPPVAESSWLATALVILFVLLFLLFLRAFLQILPYLADSLLRARGSAALENSVRVSRDRNTIALIFVIPMLLLVYRYRLYDPDFLQGASPNGRLLVIAGVFLGYILLRYLLSIWLHPRRRADNFKTAYHASYTFFIWLMLLSLVTVGLLSLFHAEDETVRGFLWVETAVVYGLYLLRRAQILSSSCSNLTTFLYLCALEFLPTGLLVASEVIL